MNESKRARILQAVAVIAAMGVAVWLLAPSPEPAWNGKRLSEWLVDYDNLSPAITVQTDEAVRHVGTSAIPILLRMVRAEDSALKLKWLALLQQQRLVKFNHKGAGLLNFEGQMGFRALGASASNAVPGLIAIGRGASSPAVQNSAVVALAGIGPPATDAVPLLISAATNSDFLLSGNAVWALGEIHGQPALAVPALVGWMENTNSWARIHLGVQAVMSLGKYGAEARPAVPELVRLLGNADSTLGRHITNALKAIEPEALQKNSKPQTPNSR